MWEERRSDFGGSEKIAAATHEFMDDVRSEYGLSKRERDALQCAIIKELAQPERQKWFRGSNNRICRVASALGKQRGTRFPKSLTDRLSLYLRDWRHMCMEPQPPQMAHPDRAAPYRVTPEMRVSIGLPPVVTCNLNAGHEGLHSWDRRPQDRAVYANWGGLFEPDVREKRVGEDREAHMHREPCSPAQTLVVA